jgi:hypothetical protein
MRMIGVIATALDNNQQNQFMSTEADEEGNFTIRGAPVGYPTLRGSGRKCARYFIPPEPAKTLLPSGIPPSMMRHAFRYSDLPR